MFCSFLWGGIGASVFGSWIKMASPELMSVAYFFGRSYRCPQEISA